MCLHQRRRRSQPQHHGSVLSRPLGGSAESTSWRARAWRSWRSQAMPVLPACRTAPSFPADQALTVQLLFVQRVLHARNTRSASVFAQVQTNRLASCPRFDARSVFVHRSGFQAAVNAVFHDLPSIENGSRWVFSLLKISMFMKAEAYGGPANLSPGRSSVPRVGVRHSSQPGRVERLQAVQGRQASHQFGFVSQQHGHINHIGVIDVTASHLRAYRGQGAQGGLLRALCSGQALTDFIVRATEAGTLFLLNLIAALFGPDFKAANMGGMPAKAGGENFSVVHWFLVFHDALSFVTITLILFRDGHI